MIYLFSVAAGLVGGFAAVLLLSGRRPRVLLIDNGFKTTCEIAIGDNLLSLPWVKDLVLLLGRIQM